MSANLRPPKSKTRDTPKQDLSFWAFLRACGKEMKKIKGVKIPSFLLGWINFMLWGVGVTFSIFDVFTFPLTLFVIPSIAIAVLSMGYGLWLDDKEDC